MAMTIVATTRSSRMNAFVTDLGANATGKFFNGTKPPALGTPAGTLLAALTYGTTLTAANGSTAGGVAGGVLTLGGFTQIAANNAAGTPTFVRFSTSAGAVISDIDIGPGAGNVQFNGTVANGQNITTTTPVTVTDGNA